MQEDTLNSLPKLFTGWALALTVGSTLAQANECNPAPKDVATLKQIRPQFHTVEGPLASFDPCHPSTKFQKPLFASKPPLMIVVHGGGGVDAAIRNAVEAFRSRGFATLVFDAYEHNGFNQGFRFWGNQATNESRQRMIYKVTLGAYEWAIKRTDIDTTQIYFHGLSNGAAVLANLAGAVSPQHVKGIFAEGATGAGLGFPDKLLVPLRLVFGKLDNYGGTTEDEWIWLRQEPCSVNVADFIHPPGSSQTCSSAANQRLLGQKPIDWYENQKRQGADIDVWFYDNAAHGIFLGPIQRNMITYGTDNRRYAWVGADPAAKNKLLDDIDRYVKSKR